MVKNEVDKLPQNSDPRGWTQAQMALMQFAGLMVEKPLFENGQVVKDDQNQPRKVMVLRDAGVAEAFLQVCRTTGLDPFTKQIYAVEMGGKMTIVVGIDGFRIIAERTKVYRGQIGPQWSTGRTIETPWIHEGVPLIGPDGHVLMRQELEWVDQWVPELYGLDKKARPFAARVGILRADFDAPLWQVVTWEEFGKTPDKEKDNWNVRPAHMLGIRAESHGFRRAFPNDLSGIYTPEDLGELESTSEAEIEAMIAQVDAIDDQAELLRLFRQWNPDGMPEAVRKRIMVHGGELKTRDEAAAAAARGEAPKADDAPPADEPPAEGEQPEEQQAPPAEEEPPVDEAEYGSAGGEPMPEQEPMLVAPDAPAEEPRRRPAPRA